MKPLPSIWVTIKKIQHTLGWNEKELLERMNLNVKAYRSLHIRRNGPSVYSIQELVNGIGLSVESVATGSIDYKALKERSIGNLVYVPDRYAEAAFSKIRTSINLLAYLETRLGWQMKRNILNHFQMSEALFYDPEAKINFRFPTDLCRYLVTSGYSQSIFYEMGAYSLVTNKQTPLGEKLSLLGSPEVLYERIFTEIARQSFDQNCDYKLMSLNSRECTVEARFSDVLKDGLNLKKPGNIFACSVRGGSFSSFTGYIDLPFSRVVEVTCIHRGDSHCKYKITFSHTQSHHELAAMNRLKTNSFH